jgi:hypothetical protein
MIINRNGESIEIPDEEFYSEHPECRPGQEQVQPSDPLTVLLDKLAKATTLAQVREAAAEARQA